MKERHRLIDARIYLREWSASFAIVIGFIALGIAGYLFVSRHFEKEFSDRSMHRANSTIERIDMYRPGPKQGFRTVEEFVFRVQGQDVEYPASFHAEPGEPVAVDYTIGSSGKVYVWKVDRGEP